MIRRAGSTVRRLSAFGLIVGVSAAAGQIMQAVPADSAQGPKPACALLPKATATRVLNSMVKVQGGNGYVCRYQGSNASQLVVSDVPNTQRWRSAIQDAVSVGDNGNRHNVSIRGARGYSVSKKYGSSVGVAYYVVYRGYFVSVGVFGANNDKNAAKYALNKTISNL